VTRVRIHNFSISLDGFATGEGQALDTPFGHAGHRLHEWMFATRFGRREVLGESGGTEGVDHAMADRYGPGIGAEIMGAGKFGPPGWQDDPEWRGWWGSNPPFHTPTYVLTHRPRPSLEMEGGTTFHFLDAAPADALEVARDAAAGQDVRIGGGPTMLRAFIAAGLVDHLHVVLVPILLGRGVRLWDGLEALEQQYTWRQSRRPAASPTSRSPDDRTAARRGHCWTRKCRHAPEASPIATSASRTPETPYPAGFLTQGAELAVDHCVTTAAGYSSSVSQGYIAAPH